MRQLALIVQNATSLVVLNSILALGGSVKNVRGVFVLTICKMPGALIATQISLKGNPITHSLIFSWKGMQWVCCIASL